MMPTLPSSPLVSSGGALPVLAVAGGLRLVAGDEVLVHLTTGGRHFGMKVEETLTEK